ncbi:MAG: DUF1343 domain-containing protein [Gammaproteobacteria bacterium]|nr:DUF1343 domain-containing protein [Gammaproteobacteria bacterium]
MVSAGFRKSRVGAGLVAAGAVLLAVNLVARGGRESAVDASGGAGAQAAGEARPGIEVLLADSIHLVGGRRAGLVTNHTGIDRRGVSTIDLLHRDARLELVALYSPEHGIRGEAEAGELVDSGMDPSTGLPIHSLYGATRKPTPEMLEGVEVLLFDIQDIGARYYTYVYTMALAMEAAGEAGIPFVVLDRPNPIGGAEVQGNVLDPAFASFVGMYPIPMRHGMTPGELARLFQGEFGVDVELGVAPLSGWSRSDWFTDTGLPWVAPSPNMPSVESARHYPGTCLFEGTNLSVGRGTPIAFQQIGAPWLDGEALAANLMANGLPGVRFEAVRFVPENPGDGKHGGVEVGGVRLVATDPGYDPTEAAVAALIEAAALSGDRWEWREAAFDRLAGTDRLRLAVEAGASLEEVRAAWQPDLIEFRRVRERYLLY